jgi:hypothetical protein
MKLSVYHKVIVILFLVLIVAVLVLGYTQTKVSSQTTTPNVIGFSVLESRSDLATLTTMGGRSKFGGVYTGTSYILLSDGSVYLRYLFISPNSKDLSGLSNVWIKVANSGWEPNE